MTTITHNLGKNKTNTAWQLPRKAPTAPTAPTAPAGIEAHSLGRIANALERIAEALGSLPTDLVVETGTDREGGDALRGSAFESVGDGKNPKNAKKTKKDKKAKKDKDLKKQKTELKILKALNAFLILRSLTPSPEKKVLDQVMPAAQSTPVTLSTPNTPPPATPSAPVPTPVPATPPVPSAAPAVMPTPAPADPASLGWPAMAYAYYTPPKPCLPFKTSNRSAQPARGPALRPAPADDPAVADLEQKVAAFLAGEHGPSKPKPKPWKPIPKSNTDGPKLADARDAWAHTLKYLQTQLPANNLRQLDGHKLLGWQNYFSALQVALPSQAQADWCQERLALLAGRFLGGVLARQVSLRFVALPPQERQAH